jgi:hypothetical protein
MMTIQRKHSQEGFVGVLLIVALMIILLVVGLLFYHSKRSTSQTIINGGYSYNFSFPNSVEVTISGQQYLKSSDGRLVVSAKPATTASDCGDNGGSVVEQATIDGSTHAICTDNNSSVYTANFEDGSTWHNVTVFSSDLSKAIGKSTAIQIITSIKVNTK